MEIVYSPFSKIKVTAQVEWVVDEGGKAPDREVQMDIAADPDLISAGAIDAFDPMNWILDEDALRELIGDKLSDLTGFLPNGFSYEFTPVP